MMLKFSLPLFVLYTICITYLCGFPKTYHDPRSPNTSSRFITGTTNIRLNWENLIIRRHPIIQLPPSSTKLPRNVPRILRIP